MGSAPKKQVIVKLESGMTYMLKNEHNFRTGDHVAVCYNFETNKPAYCLPFNANETKVFEIKAPVQKKPHVATMDMCINNIPLWGITRASPGVLGLGIEGFEHEAEVEIEIEEEPGILSLFGVAMSAFWDEEEGLANPHDYFLTGDIE